MFGSIVLDVAIGLVFTYFLLSLICSTVTEWLSHVLKMRANNLEEGIRALLNDPKGNELTQKFYNHPLIKGLTQDGLKPSYIPANAFASTLMDIIAPSSSTEGSRTMNLMKDSVNKIQNSALKQGLACLIDNAENDINAARTNIEKWFDSGMDRVSGWYKRKSQTIILVCALVVTAVLNADTISIANRLMHDTVLRAGVVAVAQQNAETPVDGTKDGEAAAKMYAELENLGFPLGWDKVPALDQIPIKIAGLLMTAFAVSLGAPFWFDLLNKFVNMRSSGARPPKSTDS